MPLGTPRGGPASFFVSSAGLVVLMGFVSVAGAATVDALGSEADAPPSAYCFEGVVVEAGLVIGAVVLGPVASDAAADCLGGTVF